MPSKKLFSASEIAAMRLPGLPATKARVITRATVEEWPFELQKGIGGTKRMYEMPERYLTAVTSSSEGGSPTSPALARVVGAVAGGTSKVDTKKLELAIRALDEWEQERNSRVSAERRPAVIALLYDHLQRAEEDGEDALELVLRALG